MRTTRRPRARGRRSPTASAAGAGRRAARSLPAERRGESAPGTSPSGCSRREPARPGEAMQLRQQALHIGRVQAGRGLVEHVERASPLRPLQLSAWLRGAYRREGEYFVDGGLCRLTELMTPRTRLDWDVKAQLFRAPAIVVSTSGVHVTVRRVVTGQLCVVRDGVVRRLRGESQSSHGLASK